MKTRKKLDFLSCWKKSECVLYICDKYHNHITWLYTRFSGFINLASGNLSAVIAAIHFLYGDIPKVSIDNAADILEEAEFLMIEELKAYTIDKIKSMEVVAENCLKMVLISLRYNVKLEDAELFFKAHLPELLSKEEALLLDQEYVYSIFTDKTLSYVSRQDLFLFLVKWVAHHPARNEAFPELMSALKLDYINSEGLDDVDMNSLNDENQTLCRTLASKTCNLDNILIFCQAQQDYQNSTSYLHAFNADKSFWFPIRLSTSFGLEKACIENKMVLVYFKDNNTLCRFNLCRNEENQKTFRWLGRLDEKYPSMPSSNGYISHLSQSADKLYVNKINSLAQTIGMPRLKQGAVSTIYCNDTTDELNVCMKSLISVRGAVTQFGVTDEIVCLIVEGSKRLTVYAADVGIISTVDLSHVSIDYDTVLSAVCGGKIYISTNTHLVQVNMSKAGLAHKTSVRETVHEGGKTISRGRQTCTRFEFTEDKRITVTKNSVNYKTTLSYAYQKLPEDIDSEHNEEKVVIDLPETLKHCQNVRLLEAYLPSDAPRCPDKCPHCSFKVRNDRTINKFYLDQYYDSALLYDSDDLNYYDDSSDDSEWNTKKYVLGWKC